MTTKFQPVMTKGAEGNLDYFVFAARGTIGLSLKFVGVSPGVKHGLKDTTHIGFKIRSSFVGQQVSGGPILLKQPPAKECWPAIKWQKIVDAGVHKGQQGKYVVSEEDAYASMSMGIFVDGDIGEDPDKFLKTLSETDVPAKLSKYLWDLIPDASLWICTSKELEGYVGDLLLPVFDNIKAQIKASKDIQEFRKETVGSFFQEADILQRFAEKFKANMKPGHDVAIPDHLGLPKPSDITKVQGPGDE